MPWIELHDTLRDHPKTWALAGALGVTNVHAVGMMACLWCWAISNAEDGDLSRFPPQAVASAAGWKRRPSAFVDALLSSGFADPGPTLHDWERYAGRLIERRKSSRERAEKSRDRARAARAPCAPTVPNQTVPTAAAADRARGEALARVCAAYREGIHPAPNSATVGALAGIAARIGPEMAVLAVREAASSGGTGIRYVEAIARRWLADGILTPERLEAEEKARDARKPDKPDRKEPSHAENRPSNRQPSLGKFVPVADRGAHGGAAPQPGAERRPGDGGV